MFLSDRIQKITIDSMANFKTQLEAKFTKEDKVTVDKEKVKMIYDIHFIVNYEQAAVNETFGDKWVRNYLD